VEKDVYKITELIATIYLTGKSLRASAQTANISANRSVANAPS
jgi:hypothetical protein